VIQPYQRTLMIIYPFSFLFFFEFSNNFPSNSSHIRSKFAAIISVNLVIRNLNHSFLKQLQNNHKKKKKKKKKKKPNITVHSHESDVIFFLFLFCFDIHSIPIISPHKYNTIQPIPAQTPYPKKP
jgi:hypothetical protein